MIKYSALSTFFCFFYLFATAQFDIDRTGLKTINEIARINLPPLNHQVLKKTYSNKKSNKPLRFAEPRDVSLNIINDGEWEDLKSDQVIWRYMIHSKGAHSINLAFSSFKLYGNASLFLYNPQRTDVFGPFTKKDNDDHGQLWTPMVEGDKIIIELQLDKKYLNDVELELARLNHDFIDIRKQVLSGACNLDVACGSEDGWHIVDNYRDIISSVGAFTLNGIDQCTGALINSTARDCRPFFLTANHCDVDDSNASSVVVFWHYENSTCRQPESLESGRNGDGQRNMFNTGAIHRASLIDSDVCLLELDDPVDPNLNLFFAGWDRNRILPDSAIGIHHPNVEEKRISFDFNKLNYDPNGQDTSYILVSDWDIGTTEPGSSGSPLFNTKKRIIGQLQGGFAACGNDEFDSYGWFRYSWEGGGDSTNSLRYWLDPNNQNLDFLDGKSCSYNIETSTNYIEICGDQTDEIIIDLSVSEFFEDNISYSITGISSGLSAKLDFEDGLKTDHNALTISGFSNLQEDDYFVEIMVDDGMNTADLRIDVYLYEELAKAPRLSLPLNNSLNQSTSLELLIERPGKVVNEFQISLDDSFNDIVYNIETDTRKIDVSNLENERVYYWRVRSHNACGESAWSETYNFSTAAVFCTQFKSLDGPITIDAISANSAISTITVPYPAMVEDINVINVKGTHDYVGDLRMSLDFNSKSSVLMSELCAESEDFNIGFDDEASSIHIPCPPTDSNVYIPKSNLSVFDNSIAGGEWDLTIEDLVNFDGGEFEEWTIEICVSDAFDDTIIPESHQIPYCVNNEINFTAFYNLKSSSSNFEIRAFDRNENAIEIESSTQLSSLNTLNLRIDTKDFIESENSVRIELVSLPSQAVSAIAVVMFYENGEAEKTIIDYPENNSTINPDNFGQVTWGNNLANSYRIQIGTDSDFSELVLDVEGLNDLNYNLDGNSLIQGDYYVRVISSHDCGVVYSDVIKFKLDEGTATVENNLLDFKLQPNPSDGVFNLESGFSLNDDCKIEVFNVQGQLIPVKVILNSSSSARIDMENQLSGIYYLRLIKEGKTILKALVKY